MINNGEVEPNRISKTVLVIDEAQDMSKDDYALVSALMKANEEMRVIAVGDDDQNIYEFRGSNSQYLYELTLTEHSRFIEMTENYRSLAISWMLPTTSPATSANESNLPLSSP